MNKPQKRGNQPQQQQQVYSRQTFYSGQLPPPNMLNEFEQIQPGFTDRLLTMVEEESKFKREADRRNFKSYHTSTILGMVSALLSVLLVCGVSAYAISAGYGTEAAAIMGTCATAVIIAFLQRRKRTSER